MKKTATTAGRAKTGKTASADGYGKHGPKAKLRWQRRFLPPLAGVLVMLLIMGLLNGELLIAQFKYRFNKPVAAAATDTTVHKAGIGNASGDSIDTKSPHPELGPRVSIPAIGVDAPVVFEPGTAEWQIQLGLRKGVVHYGNSVKPGEQGNVVLFGHSSGQPWAPGAYKFVFTLLDKVKPGDVIYVDNDGIRYAYEVRSSQVVAPTDTGVLTSGGDHELTVITCTPVGTSKNRLVVHAEQISPKPAKPMSDAAKVSPTSSLKALPGSAH